MRGCLFVLVVAAVVLGSIAWFAAAPIADAVIRSALSGNGFPAASMTIEATADPPPRLLIGQVDRLTIDASDVDWRALHARRLTPTLDGFDLVARSVAAVHGSMDEADLTNGPTPAAVASIS